ncbi:hypothetical protein GY14_26780 [Delftia tsuruhatensis]|nr:hypothetical protein GY14_26780 [Delftia tsuruhatensis]
MRNIPPLHLIAAFDAVARSQSFKQAAEELNLSDSAVSHRIRELEKLLGTPLFHRTTRVVTLSAEGAWLHQQTRAPLQALETTFGSLVLGRDVVRISALPSFARLRLVPSLTAFQRSHPDVSIAIDPTTRTVNLQQGEADIAIRFAHQRLRHLWHSTASACWTTNGLPWPRHATWSSSRAWIWRGCSGGPTCSRTAANPGSPGCRPRACASRQPSASSAIRTRASCWTRR